MIVGNVVTEGARSALGGVPIITNPRIPIGKPVFSPLTVFMHPLDEIWLRHIGDPHARLDEALVWLNLQTEWRAAQAVAALEEER
ncbi:MAG: hypothetical protein K0Q52_152 [Microbacterium sp.]|jgi:hypothetical protein|nr:hypothetical protein [Microbacterium sp.]